MRIAMLALALAGVAAPQDKKDPDVVKVTAGFENSTLEEVLDGLGTITGIPIEVDEAAKKKVDLKGAVSFKVQDTTLTSALKLLVGPQGLDVKAVDKKKVLITVPKHK